MRNGLQADRDRPVDRDVLAGRLQLVLSDLEGFSIGHLRRVATSSRLRGLFFFFIKFYRMAVTLPDSPRFIAIYCAV